MPPKKYTQPILIIIGILVIIFLLIKIQVIFTPLWIILRTLFLPFLLSGVLFYLFRPIVNFLENRGLSRLIAIGVLFLVLTIIFGSSIYFGGPLLQEQVSSSIEKVPKAMENAVDQAKEIKEEGQRKMPNSIDNALNKIENKLYSLVRSIGENAIGVLSTFMSTLVALAVTPFILFYLLKDGSHLPNIICRFLSQHNEIGAKKILHDMDDALGSYIRGQVIVSICVGVLMYIGYLIIGIPYSLILAIVAMFTNVMPFVGPIIGATPAVVVGLMESPFMALKVIIVTTIVQQIESNLISPQVMGKNLDVHPLTIILLLLVAGALGGVLGMIIAVPSYAVLKVIVRDSYRIYKLRHDDVPF